MSGRRLAEKIPHKERHLQTTESVNTNVVKVKGAKVVRDQQAPIALTGNTLGEHQTTINQIITVLRAHGLIRS